MKEEGRESLFYLGTKFGIQSPYIVTLELACGCPCSRKLFLNFETLFKNPFGLERWLRGQSVI